MHANTTDHAAVKERFLAMMRAELGPDPTPEAVGRWWQREALSMLAYAYEQGDPEVIKRVGPVLWPLVMPLAAEDGRGGGGLH